MVGNNDIRDRVPRISMPFIARNEIEGARHLQRSLRCLNDYVEEFSEALALFDFCQVQADAFTGGKLRDPEFSRIRGWQRIAARDGAMTIFHFGKTLEGINSSRRYLPTVFASVDRQRQGEAIKFLREHFVHWERLRHAVAHAGEIWKDLPSFEETAGAGKRATVRNFLSGRKLTFSFQGNWVSYELSQTSLDALVLIKREQFSAFRLKPPHSSPHRED